MFTRTISLFVLTALCATVPACDKSDDKKAAEGDKKAAAGDKKAAEGDKKAAEGDEKAAGDKEAAAGPLTLDKVGLKAEAPAGATVGDAIGGSGVMVQAPGLIVTVEEASDSRPKTIDEAKKNAEMYSPENMKDEELDDGFVLTFDNEGGMGKNYFVSVRREIGEKHFWCETTASQPEQQANAVAFCKSLTQ
jgi:hypothetical protein